MESQLLDGYLAPTLIPFIMSISLFEQSKYGRLDLLYATSSFGTMLSTTISLLQFHLNRYTRSRVQLTILTATLLTSSLVTSIIGFHLIRNNRYNETYELPLAVREQNVSSGSDVFRYHFFADFLPGFIIFLQTQLCSMISHELLVKAKRNFTLGEASIISQLASSAYLVWALSTYYKISGAGPFKVHLTSDIILNTGVIVFALVLLPCHLFIRGKATVTRYSLIILSIAISCATIKSLVGSTMSLNPWILFLENIIVQQTRSRLFSIWLAIVVACIQFSVIWTKGFGRTNSLVRKVFHLAIIIVFMSGYHQDLEFTLFAAGCMVILLVLLEMVRAWELKPLGYPLEQVCKSLRGKWDNSYLTLSHMYLLIGTFLPLWILPNRSPIGELFSGLISVGVGDTAAAIVGTFFGKTVIVRGKTMEGLIGNLLAMIVFKFYCLGYTGFINEFPFVIAATLTSISEAITKSCDNLILPLVMIVAMKTL